MELTFVALRRFSGGHCSFYLCIYMVAEGEVSTVGSSPGAFPNRRALWRFSTVLRSWCDTELWKRIGGGNLQQGTQDYRAAHYLSLLPFNFGVLLS